MRWRLLFSDRIKNEIEWAKTEYEKKPGTRNLELFGVDGPEIITKLANLLDELAEDGQVRRVIEFTLDCHGKTGNDEWQASEENVGEAVR